MFIEKLSSLQDCELSFEEGDMLFITDRTDPTWWQAILDNKKGYVRSDHGQLVSLFLSPYFLMLLSLSLSIACSLSLCHFLYLLCHIFSCLIMSNERL